MSAGEHVSISVNGVLPGVRFGSIRCRAGSGLAGPVLFEHGNGRHGLVAQHRSQLQQNSMLAIVGIQRPPAPLVGQESPDRIAMFEEDVERSVHARLLPIKFPAAIFPESRVVRCYELALLGHPGATGSHRSYQIFPERRFEKNVFLCEPKWTSNEHGVCDHILILGRRVTERHPDFASRRQARNGENLTLQTDRNILAGSKRIG
mmetsp:Transcript_12490/g.27581  ORF Transcript_12490/g.27581 Transcript_12490/m.27581 type:complete len:205 (-) Transcript_12490:482-1096(-)